SLQADLQGVSKQEPCDSQMIDDAFDWLIRLVAQRVCWGRVKCKHCAGGHNFHDLNLSARAPWLPIFDCYAAYMIHVMSQDFVSVQTLCRCPRLRYVSFVT